MKIPGRSTSSAVSSLAVAVLLLAAIPAATETDASDISTTDPSLADPCPTVVLTVSNVSCPTVTAIVDVTDATGKPVAGLTASSFCLSEEGMPQAITLTHVGPGPGEASLSVAVLIDNSGSAGPAAFADEKTAARAFVAQLGSNDRAAIYGFTGTVDLVRDFTAIKPDLDFLIYLYPYKGGQVALYDAVYASLANSASKTGRRAVVVMVGSVDGVSTRTKDEVIAYARQFGITIYPVGFGSADSAVLREIATQTGGTYLASASSEDLQQVLTRLATALDNEYLISYRTTKNDGQAHNLDVCVTLNGCTRHATGTFLCSPPPPPPPCVATRTLPPSYGPGRLFWLSINVSPPRGTRSYAVEETPPSGLAVLYDPNFDPGSGKLKWGPFFDDHPRSFFYEVSALAGTTGTLTFSGVLWIDGSSQPICGPSSLPHAVYHPADVSGDSRITVSEATVYGGYWRSGSQGLYPPYPIPIDYVTNAGLIAKSGEVYHYDSSLTPPFVPGADARRLAAGRGSEIGSLELAASTATSTLSPSSYTPGSSVLVSIAVVPGAAAHAYAVEEVPPTGWTLTDIGSGGIFDYVNKKIKWGPFLDSSNRTLSYRVTPSSSESGIATFSGVASFDGASAAVGGARSIAKVVSSPQLLLSNQRVAVSATWTSPYTGEGGYALPTPQKDEFGYFYFTSPSNPEVFVKVLDFGSRFAVFCSVLSDYRVEVTFTVLATGQSRTFLKDSGAPGGDFDSVTLRTSGPPGLSVERSEPLLADPTEIALSSGRVSVQVTWQSKYSSQGGTAFAIPQQDEFAYFYFTDRNNPEVFVKVLDFGTRFAVLSGGLTDYQYTVTFKVLATGQTLVFNRPAGQRYGFGDSWTLAPPPSEITVSLPGGVPLVMVKIPAGTFLMGSPPTERFRDSSEALHSVTLTSDYFIGKYPVTQEQFRAVTGDSITPGYGDSGIGPSYPMYWVGWYYATGGFMNKLNAYLTSTGQAGAGKFRLPTEAEWERAARGGTQSRFSFGDALDSDDFCRASAEASPYVWWCGNSGNMSHPVGMKAANQFGLYDMHGNVSEWVNDWFGDYPESAQTNPTGPTTGTYRVIRGCGWGSYLSACRSASRIGKDPAYDSTSLGFRLARSQ